MTNPRDTNTQILSEEENNYEFIKQLVERQLAYMMHMVVEDTDYNKGQRDEADRTLTWLRDVVETEFNGRLSELQSPPIKHKETER